ncbi:AAA family ATPase [Runella rosea]|uniref:AAA family ATPase n=1 Tax=Runella rosea TaxID=2259595 RepID=A0A344TH27_9BACT|nr:AAA family ATPase [Runella rosea]AXE17948.1 AAA family ATPase [Runella rosea]
MQLQPAQRKNVKIKLGLQGSSGSGKTYSALLMAFGLVNDWKQIAVIDTENQSASLYAHLGSFYILPLKPPFSPELYIQAIKVCTEAKIQVVIIDSLSLEWEYILDAHSQLTGNSYTNWAKFTPRHQQLIQAILQADCHIICTLRAKQDYVLNEKNGKQVPEKVGMKPIQREGTDYELTLVFELDNKHHAIATKDRTGLFAGQPEFTITAQTGKLIYNWCQLGQSDKPFHEYIIECQTMDELRELYLSHPEYQQSHLSYFNQRKTQLQTPVSTILSQTLSTNGTATRQ